MSEIDWVYEIQGIQWIQGIQRIYKIKQMECTGYMISRIQGKGIIWVNVTRKVDIWGWNTEDI